MDCFQTVTTVIICIWPKSWRFPSTLCFVTSFLAPGGSLTFKIVQSNPSFVPEDHGHCPVTGGISNAGRVVHFGHNGHQAEVPSFRKTYNEKDCYSSRLAALYINHLLITCIVGSVLSCSFHWYLFVAVWSQNVVQAWSLTVKADRTQVFTS